MRLSRGGGGMGEGSSPGSCSEGNRLHKSQDVMVYSAQEWGRHGQGASCPHHHAQLDL